MKIIALSLSVVKKGRRMQQKTFDPRSSKVTNPFVQAYLEKQAGKAKPIGDRQKVVNIILSGVLFLNFAVLGALVWTSRANLVTELTGGEEQNTAMGEAMAKIKQLEINLQAMSANVEFHKNAYYKLEQEHETMKAALARVVPAENMKETLANYPNAQFTPAMQAVETQSAQAVQAAREAAVAAQQLPLTNGQ